MKKTIFIFILYALLCNNAFSQGRRVARSIIQLSLSNGQPLTVTIDGRDYNRVGRFIRIGDLPTGYHSIRVYQYAQNSRRRNNARLVYAGSIRTRANQLYVGNIDVNSGRMSLTRSEILNPDDMETNYHGDQQRPLHGNNSADVYNDQASSRYRNPYNNSRKTDQYSINDLKQGIQNLMTDTDKMKLIQTKLIDLEYTTANVIELMQLLTFEVSKIELAKFGFGAVQDPQNYTRILSHFTYESSKDELIKFIQDNSQ